MPRLYLPSGPEGASVSCVGNVTRRTRRECFPACPIYCSPSASYPITSALPQSQPSLRQPSPAIRTIQCPFPSKIWLSDFNLSMTDLVAPGSSRFRTRALSPFRAGDTEYQVRSVDHRTNARERDSRWLLRTKIGRPGSWGRLEHENVARARGAQASAIGMCEDRRTKTISWRKNKFRYVHSSQLCMRATKYQSLRIPIMVSLRSAESFGTICYAALPLSCQDH